MLRPFYHPSLSALLPLSAELPVLPPCHDAGNGFITPTDKLKDMIRISQQLVPDCLNGRGYCQVNLQSVLCCRSLCCHFPSHNSLVLTGEGSKAIPWTINREERDLRLLPPWRAPDVHQVGSSLQRRGWRQSVHKLHKCILFWLKFLRDWIKAHHHSKAPLAHFTNCVT